MTDVITTIVVYTVAGIIAYMIFLLISKYIGPKAYIGIKEKATSEITLYYSRSSRRLTIVFLICWLIFSSFGIIGLISDQAELNLFIFYEFTFLLLIGLPGTYLFIEFRFARVIVSNIGLQRRSPWKKDLFIPWFDIISIEYSNFNDWFIIIGKNGKIRISVLMSGLSDFAKAVNNYLPREKWENIEGTLNKSIEMDHI